MLRSSQYITVVVENGRVSIAGRVYETSHAILVGAEGLSASISYGSVRVEAVFPIGSNIESQVDDVVKIQAPESRFEVDTLGSKLSEFESRGGMLILKGQIVSIKFEGDDDHHDIIVKIPRYKRLRAKRVEVRTGGKTALNIITSPFTIGVLTVYNTILIVKIGEEDIVVETS